MSDEAVLRELGQRLAHVRLQRNIPQLRLAEEAGVERKAVLRLEAGEPVQLTTLIRILRALDLVDALDLLVPEVEAAPMELLQRRNKTRRRARQSPRSPGESGGAWRWGDEAR